MMQDLILGAVLLFCYAAIFYKRRLIAAIFRDGTKAKIAELKERRKWAECCADDDRIKILDAWIALNAEIQRGAEWVLGEKKLTK